MQAAVYMPVQWKLKNTAAKTAGGAHTHTHTRAAFCWDFMDVVINKAQLMYVIETLLCEWDRAA